MLRNLFLSALSFTVLLSANPAGAERNGSPKTTPDPSRQSIYDTGDIVTLEGDVPAGADRDAHGCIGSAGYSWCRKTGRCEHPWELAREHGFGNTKKAFDSFCNNPQQRDDVPDG